MSLATRLLCFLLAFQIGGGHWVTLQSLAWVRMTVEFANEMPVCEAIVKAVSGNAPCQMCRTVRKGHLEEGKQVSLGLLLKSDAIVSVSITVALSGNDLPPAVAVHSCLKHWVSRGDAPPTPPPLA